MLINVGGLIIRILFVTFLVPRYGLQSYVIGMFTGYIMMMLIMGLTIRSIFKEKALKQA